MPDTTIQITVPLRITHRLIANIVTTALEGGITYWCPEAHYDNQTLRGRCVKPGAGPVYDMPEYWQAHGGMELSCPDHRVRRNLSAKSITDAIQLAANQRHQSPAYERIINDLLHDNVDAETADLIVQLAVFDEIVFG